MFPPNEYTRERLLISGRQKTGKTAALLEICRLLDKSESGSRVFWFDSESALYDAEAIVAPLIGRGMMVPVQGSRFEDFARFSDLVLEQARDDDWVMCDKVDVLWKWTRQYYLREVKKVDWTTKMRELAKQGKTGWEAYSATIQRSEWETITGFYDEVTQPLIMGASDRPKLHLAWVTEVRDLDDDDPLKGHSKTGTKPTGQGSLPYMLRTVVTLEQLKALGHVYSTLERHGSGRENADRKPFKNFALTYLVQECGWKMKLPKDDTSTGSNSTDPTPRPESGATPPPPAEGPTA